MRHLQSFLTAESACREQTILSPACYSLKDNKKLLYIPKNFKDPIIYKTQDFIDYKKNIEFVDLGLSVKWASVNLGAASPNDTGGFYAWGETQTKVNYSRGTYKYYNEASSKYTKYNDTDGLRHLQLSDDPGHVNWRGCRVPTHAEWIELQKLRSEYTSPSIIFKGNGNTLYIPLAGYCTWYSHILKNQYGAYMTANLASARLCRWMFFNAQVFANSSTTTRWDGMSVRLVQDY